MTLILNLTPEIEQYLSQKATEQGISVESYTLQLLTDIILNKEKQIKIDLRELLGFEVFVFTQEILKDNYREQILQNAMSL